MRLAAPIVGSVLIIAAAYGATSLWRTAGQIGQASTTLISRTSPAQSAAPIEPSFDVDVVDEPLEDDAAAGFAEGGAVFESAEHADAFAADAPLADDLEYADSGVDEPYAADLEGAEYPSDEPYEDTDLDARYAERDPAEDAYDESLEHDGSAEEELYTDEPPLEESPFDAPVDDSDPTLVLQALLNDPDPLVRDEAARLLLELQTLPPE